MADLYLAGNVPDVIFLMSNAAGSAYVHSQHKQKEKKPNPSFLSEKNQNFNLR